LQKAINDVRLARTRKPEVVIWRKPHKRTVPLSVGAGSPSNRMSPGPGPTSVASGILIRPTVYKSLLKEWTVHVFGCNRDCVRVWSGHSGHERARNEAALATTARPRFRLFTARDGAGWRLSVSRKEVGLRENRKNPVRSESSIPSTGVSEDDVAHMITAWHCCKHAVHQLNEERQD